MECEWGWRAHPRRRAGESTCLPPVLRYVPPCTRGHLARQWLVVSPCDRFCSFFPCDGGDGSEARTASRIASDAAAGRRKAVDVCNEALGRIGAVDPQLGALLAVTREHALRHAEQVDADVATGRSVGPLAAVPTSRNRKTWPRRNTTQPIQSTPRSSPSPGDRIVVVTSARPTAPGATDTTLVPRLRPGDPC